MFFFPQFLSDKLGALKLANSIFLISFSLVFWRFSEMKLAFFAVFLTSIFLEISGQRAITCQDVLTIRMDESLVISTPPSTLPTRITEVRFWRSSIVSPLPEVFSTFPNINILTIFGQEVQRIRPRTFQDAKNLDLIELNSNRLTRLETNSFEGAANLKTLYLYVNEINFVDPNAFKGLPNLENIWLQYNRIETLHTDTFRNNLKLRVIYLQFNRLNTLNPQMFSHLVDLYELFLEGNRCVNRSFRGAAKAEIESALQACR